MPKTRISPRPERSEQRRASARAYRDLCNEVGKAFAPLQQEAIDKWLAWDEAEDAQKDEISFRLAAKDLGTIDQSSQESLPFAPVGTFEVEGMIYEALADLEGHIFLRPSPPQDKTYLVLYEGSPDEKPYALSRAEGKDLCKVSGLGRGELGSFFSLLKREKDQYRISFR